MFETKQGIIKPIVYLGIIRNEKLLLVDYHEPPNPTKTGWWIPAPGLEFGEDPEELALNTLKKFGFPAGTPKLKKVESFLTPGGWHILFHFICWVQNDLSPTPEVKNYMWATRDELETIKGIAHGRWEVELGKSFLETAAHANPN